MAWIGIIHKQLKKSLIMFIYRRMLECQQHTSTNKISACTIAEVMKYSITMVLQHLCMNIETRISKFCDFLGKELDPIHRIAEDDRLVYLQLE